MSGSVNAGSYDGSPKKDRGGLELIAKIDCSTFAGVGTQLVFLSTQMQCGPFNFRQEQPTGVRVDHNRRADNPPGGVGVPGGTGYSRSNLALDNRQFLLPGGTIWGETSTICGVCLLPGSNNLCLGFPASNPGYTICFLINEFQTSPHCLHVTMLSSRVIPRATVPVRSAFKAQYSCVPTSFASKLVKPDSRPARRTTTNSSPRRFAL